jgi:glycosyltransferase involved in cell wall biosynthesis
MAAMFSAQRKRELRARYDTDRFRPLLRVGLDGVNAVAAAAQRPIDLGRDPAPTVPVDAVTAVIKTFQRPRQVRRLVASIRRVQPDLPIIVVDDNRDPTPIPGTELLAMPFNSGISAGRNAALRRVETPYVLLLDDDFVFTRQTSLAGPIAAMEAVADIDILGGAVVNLPDFSVNDYSLIAMEGHPATPRFALGSMVGGLAVHAKVPNFFVGRTERVLSVGWTEELKVLEHAEFFWRAWGELTTVYDPTWRVLHARNPFDRSSPERNENLAAARQTLARLR